MYQYAVLVHYSCNGKTGLAKHWTNINAKISKTDSQDEYIDLDEEVCFS